MVGALVVFAAIGWFATRSSDDADFGGEWIEATTASGRRVELPGTARRLDETRDIAGAPLALDVLVVGEGGLDRLAPGAFFIEAALPPEVPISVLQGDPALVRTLLEAQGRAVLTAAGVEWSGTTEAAFSKGTAIQLEGSASAEQLEVRAFIGLDGSNVLAAIVVLPRSEIGRAQAMLDRIVASVD